MILTITQLKRNSVVTKLSVNINKLATLRNSRGKNNPDVQAWTQEIEAYGVHGITVHPRPDERHIRYHDVELLKPLVRGEFNIEGYPDERWIELVAAVHPHQATLVPDPPGALTSNAGFDVKVSRAFLEKAIGQLKQHTPSLRVSVFIEPGRFSKEEARALRELGADRIEMYTEKYADDPRSVGEYRELADLALHAGLGLNAGHDLTSENLPALIHAIPEIEEVSIGHALICDALRFGMKETIGRYLAALGR